MATNLATCAPESTVALAVDLMLRHQVHALPVVNALDHLVGIVTSSDLLRLLKDRGIELSHRRLRLRLGRLRFFFLRFFGPE